ncbi:uncharacterized protein LOC114751080 isoform X2 [Neltuma alba]|uniref:uncharacterized protein LOC114751080 isoform X2 n=1 Tax=Neltuma alba TaxID=207710 RepID=UPI0010A3467B|nr:uncharacterized protein LOC114751080 isoform X2 [Prosopis alba]
MGGDSISSQGEDSCSDVVFSTLSSNSPTLTRDSLSMKVENDTVNGENGLARVETGEINIGPSSSSFDLEVNNRRKHRIYQEILQKYDERTISCKNLKEEREKILSYSPGVWTENVGGLKLSDYDVPKTTCLILIGPRGSGKSSLINRISKVFEVGKYATARAQVSCNSSTGDGTYFLQEYMIPRSSTSICLYDTRCLSGNPNDDDRILYQWMTKGVSHGELVLRSTDDQRLKKLLKHRACKTDFFFSKRMKVNFVIYVANGLSLLKSLENTGASERGYADMVASTFNCPYLSFKDDKPVLVVTHGDLLSLSDRARVCAYLVELLGVPPTQIFDIPECDDCVTEFTIIEMLRYTLEHADRNYPPKIRVMDKVHKASLSIYMILLILGLGIAIALACDKFIHPCHPHRHGWKILGPGAKHKAPGLQPKIEWHKIRHIW